jgi:beta-glucanase (GH16 family)
MNASHRSIARAALALTGMMLASGCAVHAAGGSAPKAAGEWLPVWSDEFDGDRIDPAKWGLEANCWGGGNDEQQCYTSRKDDAPGANAFVRDGVLHLVARRENFTGPNTPDGSGTTTATLPYTSARLRTKNLQEWTFGRFEIRARLPRGQGTWPAIWMLPTDSRYGTWAASGEIDIMEAVNLGAPSDAPGAAPGTPETRVHGTLHYGRVWPGNAHAGTWYTLPNGASPADDFHVYALEWEHGEIRWYVDGVHYATQSARWWYSRYARDGQLVDAPFGAPFDRRSKYHLLLNLAVGGNWAGNVNARGIDASAFPQTMQVDWVRVFRCSSSPKTGTGCATRGADARLVVPPPGQRRPGAKADAPR